MTHIKSIICHNFAHREFSRKREHTQRRRKRPLSEHQVQQQFRSWRSQRKTWLVVEGKRSGHRCWKLGLLSCVVEKKHLVAVHFFLCAGGADGASVARKAACAVRVSQNVRRMWICNNTTGKGQT